MLCQNDLYMYVLFIAEYGNGSRTYPSNVLLDSVRLWSYCYICIDIDIYCQKLAFVPNYYYYFLLVVFSPRFRPLTGMMSM